MIVVSFALFILLVVAWLAAPSASVAPAKFAKPANIPAPLKVGESAA